MTTRHKWADVIHAYAEGKAIQYRVVNGGKNHEWSDWTHFDHRHNVEWRIKPEKKTYWVNVYKSTPYPLAGLCYPSKEEAVKSINMEESRIKTISFEVEE